MDVDPKPVTSHSLNPQSTCSPTLKGNSESFEDMETHLSICILITDWSFRNQPATNPVDSLIFFIGGIVDVVPLLTIPVFVSRQLCDT